MNGEMNELLREIDKRLVKQETLAEMFNKNSEQSAHQYASVMKRLNSLPCESRMVRMDDMEKGMDRLWGFVLAVVLAIVAMACKTFIF